MKKLSLLIGLVVFLTPMVLLKNNLIDLTNNKYTLDGPFICYLHPIDSAKNKPIVLTKENYILKYL